MNTKQVDPQGAPSLPHVHYFTTHPSSAQARGFEGAAHFWYLPGTWVPRIEPNIRASRQVPLNFLRHLCAYAFNGRREILGGEAMPVGDFKPQPSTVTGYRRNT